MDERNSMFYLTEEELKKIKNWIAKNKFSLDSGYFELHYDFTPLGSCANLFYHDGNNRYILEIFEFECRDNIEKPVKQITIGGVRVKLALSKKSLAKYFQLARECTTAHIEEDCEPPGYSVTFVVNKNGYKIYAGNNLLEIIPW
ncbi:hypothetical protein FHQ18_09635 [Deferribacter autotrophicus]|uniref:Uncharacterized protein n=1 Tax=Deferribacter autotrophicus TaxID=500465 RepID=A0A5A8F2Y7_9BACT|nr:hypothetical protein [Deferribacter autotrophicus]KAA0257301.1 hypothetical protein FHQ18_09635 [Deferribacter autotrophicus]